MTLSIDTHFSFYPLTICSSFIASKESDYRFIAVHLFVGIFHRLIIPRRKHLCANHENHDKTFKWQETKKSDIFTSLEVI